MTDPTTMSFDAGILARGWLSAFLATSSDSEVPVLYQTLALEVYDGAGIRLTATDRFMFLTAWCPCLDSASEDEPAVDIAPSQSLVFRDDDLRAKGLLTYLRKLAVRAAKDDSGIPMPTVDLVLGLTADEGESPSFPGMELAQVAIAYPGNEMVRCDVIEGTFPDWRAILTGHKRVKADHVVLNPDLLARVSALGKIHGAYLEFGLGGPRKMVSLSPVGDVPPIVRGGLMPVRTTEDAAAEIDAA